jgi:hypothetical protein
MPMHDRTQVPPEVHRDFHVGRIYAIRGALNGGLLPPGYYALAEDAAMPMHDWTRVEAGIYHHFHGSWIYAISGALNGGLLPKDYYALAEQTMRTIGPDVLALHSPAGNGVPDGPPLPAGPGGVAVAVARPKARIEAKETRGPASAA